MRDWRPVALFVAAFAVLALGQRIPLPGLDREMVELQLSGSADLLSRVSILALGIGPVLTAFAFARIAGLLLPVVRWQAGAPRVLRWMRIGTVLVAVSLALLQGYGVLIAIAQSGLVAAQADWFAVAGLACFVGGTACLVWLAERSWPLGVWLLFSVAFLTILPTELAAWLELWRMGVLRPVDALLPVLYLVAAAALVAVAHAVLLRALPPDEEGEATAVEILVWPPFLAGIVGALLFTPLVLAVPQLGEDALLLGILRIVLLAVFVPVFSGLAAQRRWRGPSAADAAVRRPVVLLVILVQLAVCFGGEWLLRVAAGPVGLAGTPVIALVATMLVIGRALALPAWSDAPAGQERG